SQDLFNDEIEWLGHRCAQVVDIRLGIQQPVDMVDAQAVQRAIFQHREDTGMSVAEHGRQFHTHAGEVVDVEEAAVVDIIAGDAEIGDAPGLLLDQAVERSAICGRHCGKSEKRSLKRSSSTSSWPSTVP